MTRILSQSIAYKHFISRENTIIDVWLRAEFSQLRETFFTSHFWASLSSNTRVMTSRCWNTQFTIKQIKDIEADETDTLIDSSQERLVRYCLRTHTSRAQVLIDWGPVDGQTAVVYQPTTTTQTTGFEMHCQQRLAAIRRRRRHD